MDGCPNAEEAAAPASSLMPGEFFLGEIAEGGDDVNLEWLSMFVEDCLSSSSYPNKLLNPPPLSSSKPQNQVKPSTTHPSKARSKRARNSVMRDPPPLLHQTHWLAESELIIFPKSIPADEEVKEQGSRRCSHCLSQRTPQWRAGPMGPKTLCNACGVRFKSGRLLPEYRPAKSPTFVSDKHSNSHKKVMEMRMDLLPSHHPK